MTACCPVFRQFLRLILFAFTAQVGWADDNSGDFLTRLHRSTESKGFLSSAEYTGDGFGNFSGGLRTGAIYEGLLKLGLQLDLKTMFQWDGASIAASALYPHGEGLTREYSGDFNVLSNITQYNSFRLFEFWFEQKFFNDLFSVRIGQMSADQEFWSSNTANLYINSAFGTFPTISMNTFTSNYPVGSLSLRLSYQPSEFFLFRAGVFDADPGLANLNNKHGTRFHLNPGNGLIGLAEAVFTLNGSPNSAGLPATYKLGGLYDSRLTSFSGQQHGGDYVLYFLLDQMIYRAPTLNSSTRVTGSAENTQGASSMNPLPARTGLFVFLRNSVAPQEDRNTVTFYIDGGLNYVGLIPNRAADVIGLAFSYTKISNDLRVPALGPQAIHSGHETIIEGDYKLQVNDHFYLQPTFQYIFNPGAYYHQANAFVGGLRFDFTY